MLRPSSESSSQGADRRIQIRPFTIRNLTVPASRATPDIAAKRRISSGAQISARLFKDERCGFALLTRPRQSGAPSLTIILLGAERQSVASMESMIARSFALGEEIQWAACEM